MAECVVLLLFWLKSQLEKDAISAGPKEDFLPHPITAHPPTIKAQPKKKNEQNNAFCLLVISFPHKVHNIRIEKQ